MVVAIKKHMAKDSPGGGTLPREGPFVAGFAQGVSGDPWHLNRRQLEVSRNGFLAGKDFYQCLQLFISLGAVQLHSQTKVGDLANTGFSTASEGFTNTANRR